TLRKETGEDFSIQDLPENTMIFTAPDGTQVTFIDTPDEHITERIGEQEIIIHENEDGSLTVPEGDNTVTYYPEGSRLVVDSSGIEERYDEEGLLVSRKSSEGDTTYFLRDGSTALVCHADGSVETRLSEGSIVLRSAGGNIISVTLPDETAATLQEDGTWQGYDTQSGLHAYAEDGIPLSLVLSDSTTTYFRNGLSRTVFTDGRSQWTTGEGLTIEVASDFALSGTDASGDPLSLSWEGEEHETIRIENPDSSFSLLSSAGDLERYIPNGVQILYSSDGNKIFTLSNGTEVSISASGSVAAHDAEGVTLSALQEYDGKLVAYYPDGRVAFLTLDGTEYLSSASGCIRKGAADGTSTYYLPGGITLTRLPGSSPEAKDSAGRNLVVSILEDGNFTIQEVDGESYTFDPVTLSGTLLRNDASRVEVSTSGVVTLYDSQNRIIEKVEPDGSHTEYTYFEGGGKRIRYPDNTREEYDAGGKLVLKEDPQGVTTLYHADGSYTVRELNGQVDEYDQDGVHLSRLSPEGMLTAYRSDGSTETQAPSGVSREVLADATVIWTVPGILLGLSRDTSGTIGDLVLTVAPGGAVSATLGGYAVSAEQHPDGTFVVSHPDGYAIEIYPEIYCAIHRAPSTYIRSLESSGTLGIPVAGGRIEITPGADNAAPVLSAEDESGNPLTVSWEGGAPEPETMEEAAGRTIRLARADGSYELYHSDLTVDYYTAEGHLSLKFLPDRHINFYTEQGDISMRCLPDGNYIAAGSLGLSYIRDNQNNLLGVILPGGVQAVQQEDGSFTGEVVPGLGYVVLADGTASVSLPEGGTYTSENGLTLVTFPPGGPLESVLMFEGGPVFQYTGSGQETRTINYLSEGGWEIFSAEGAARYDVEGTLIRSTDSQMLQSFYDSQGRVTRREYPGGQIVTLTYNLNGSYLVDDPSISGTKEYYKNLSEGGYLWKKEFSDGTWQEFDSQGRVTAFLQATGECFRITYFENGDKEYASAGVTFREDAAGNLLWGEQRQEDGTSVIFYPDGKTEQYRAPGEGETRGSLMARYYTQGGNPNNASVIIEEFAEDGTTLTRITLADNTQYTFNTDGTYFKEGYGFREIYQPDENMNPYAPSGRLMGKEEEGVGVTLYTYFEDGSECITRPDGTKEYYRAPAEGGANGETHGTLSRKDLPVTLEGPPFQGIRSTFYAEDGTTVTKIMEPDGTQREYRPDGTVSRLYLPSGKIQDFDESGGLSREVNPSASGNITVEYQPDGSRTQTYADNTVETYRPDGTLGERVFADGTEETYDSLGRLSGISYADGTAISIASDGTRIVTEPNGTEFHFDAEGHLTSQVLPGTTPVEYQFNSETNTLTLPNGGTITLRADGTIEKYTAADGCQYIYDTSGKLTQVKDADNNIVFGQAFNTGGTRTLEFADFSDEIAADGSLTTRTLANGAVVSFNTDGTYSITYPPTASGSRRCDSYNSQNQVAQSQYEDLVFTYQYSESNGWQVTLPGGEVHTIDVPHYLGWDGRNFSFVLTTAGNLEITYPDGFTEVLNTDLKLISETKDEETYTFSYNQDGTSSLMSPDGTTYGLRGDHTLSLVQAGESREFSFDAFEIFLGSEDLSVTYNQDGTVTQTYAGGASETCDTSGRIASRSLPYPEGGPSGSDLTIFSYSQDGVRTTTFSDGRALLESQEGTGQANRSDGSLETVYFGASFNLYDPAGRISTTRYPDDSVLTHFLDGGYTSIPSSGEAEVRRSDGSLKEKFYADGTVEFFNEKEVLVERRLTDGTKEIHHENGDISYYRSEGTIEKVLHPDGSCEIYDNLGQLIESFDANGIHTDHLPDGSTVLTYTDLSTESYNSSGIITGRNYSGGASEAFDELGRLIESSYPDGTTVSYSSDGARTVTTPNGTEFHFDAEGCFTSQTLPGTAPQTYTFDPVSGALNLSNPTVTNNPDGTVTWTYTGGETETYDASGSLISRSLPFPEGGPQGMDVTTFSYLPDDVRETTFSDGSYLLEDSDGTREFYRPNESLEEKYLTGSHEVYDPADRLAFRWLSDGSATAFFLSGKQSTISPDSVIIIRRDDGTILKKIYASGEIAVEYFDAQERLTEQVFSDGAIKNYAYNQDNSYAINFSTGRIEEYDAQSRITKITFPDESWESTQYLAGNLRKVTYSSGEKKVYDSENRLIHWEEADGSGIFDYAYTAEGMTATVASSLQRLLRSDNSERWTLPDGTIVEISADGATVAAEKDGQAVPAEILSDGRISLGYSDNIAIILNRSEFQIAANAGNGLSRAVLPNNTITLTQANGTVTRLKSDGTVDCTRDSQNAVLPTVILPSGAIRITEKDGTFTTINTDLSITRSSPNGLTRVINQDGSSEFTFSDTEEAGALTITCLLNADGTLPQEAAHDSEENILSATLNQDGSISITSGSLAHTLKMDLSREVLTQSNIKVEYKSDGREIWTQPDGTKTYVRADGTVAPYSEALKSGEDGTRDSAGSVLNSRMLQGKIHILKQDGASLDLLPGYSMKYTTLSGFVRDTLSSGVKEIHSFNGVLTTIQADGTFASHDAGGGELTTAYDEERHLYVISNAPLTLTLNPETLLEEVSTGTEDYIFWPTGEREAVSPGQAPEISYDVSGSLTLTLHLTDTDSFGQTHPFHLTTTIQSDFSRVTSVPGGLSKTLRLDGSYAFHLPGGTVVEFSSQGAILSAKDSGENDLSASWQDARTLLIHNQNGTTTAVDVLNWKIAISNPVGLEKIIFADAAEIWKVGAEVTVEVSPAAISVRDAADKALQVKKNADGSVAIQRMDGSTLTLAADLAFKTCSSPNGVSWRYEPDITVITHPCGTTTFTTVGGEVLIETLDAENNVIPTTLNADGSLTITPQEGHPILVREDLTRDLLVPNGIRLRYRADNTSLLIQPDGTTTNLNAYFVATTDAQGRALFSYRDASGNVVIRNSLEFASTSTTITPDYTRTILGRDGRFLILFPDDVLLSLNPDGSETYQKVDGTLLTIDKGGNLLSTTRSEDLSQIVVISYLDETEGRIDINANYYRVVAKNGVYKEVLADPTRNNYKLHLPENIVFPWMEVNSPYSSSYAYYLDPQGRLGYAQKLSDGTLKFSLSDGRAWELKPNYDLVISLGTGLSRLEKTLCADGSIRIKDGMGLWISITSDKDVTASDRYGNALSAVLNQDGSLTITLADGTTRTIASDLTVSDTPYSGDDYFYNPDASVAALDEEGYALSFTQSDDSTTTRNEDGTWSVIRNDGSSSYTAQGELIAWTRSVPGGLTRTVYGAGSTNPAPGSIIYELPSGVTVTRLANETLSATYQGNNYTGSLSLTDDGSIQVTEPDGKISLISSGLRQTVKDEINSLYGVSFQEIIRLDGSREIHQFDGSILEKDSSGVITTFLPPAGGGTPTRNQDGTYTAILNDGSVSNYDTSGILVDNTLMISNGYKRIIKTDGTLRYELGSASDWVEVKGSQVSAQENGSSITATMAGSGVLTVNLSTGNYVIALNSDISYFGNNHWNCSLPIEEMGNIPSFIIFHTGSRDTYNPDGVITHTDAEGEFVSLEVPSGAAKTEQQDGSWSVTLFDGSLSSYDPSGNFIENVLQEGYLTRRLLPDDVLKWEFANGLTREQHADGTVFFTRTDDGDTVSVSTITPDGSVSTVDGDNDPLTSSWRNNRCLTVENGDGATTEIYVTGLMITRDAIGVLTIRQPNGVLTTRQSDGSYASLDLENNPVTTIKDGSGNVTISNPEGSTLQVMAGGQEWDLDVPDYLHVHYNAPGASINQEWTFADGTHFHVGPDDNDGGSGTDGEGHSISLSYRSDGILKYYHDGIRTHLMPDLTRVREADNGLARFTYVDGSASLRRPGEGLLSGNLPSGTTETIAADLSVLLDGGRTRVEIAPDNSQTWYQYLDTVNDQDRFIHVTRNYQGAWDDRAYDENNQVADDVEVLSGGVIRIHLLNTPYELTTLSDLTWSRKHTNLGIEMCLSGETVSFRDNAGNGIPYTLDGDGNYVLEERNGIRVVCNHENPDEYTVTNGYFSVTIAADGKETWSTSRGETVFVVPEKYFDSSIGKYRFRRSIDAGNSTNAEGEYYGQTQVAANGALILASRFRPAERLFIPDLGRLYLTAGSLAGGREVLDQRQLPDGTYQFRHPDGLTSVLKPDWTREIYAQNGLALKTLADGTYLWSFPEAGVTYDGVNAHVGNVAISSSSDSSGFYLSLPNRDLLTVNTTDFSVTTYYADGKKRIFNSDGTFTLYDRNRVEIANPDPIQIANPDGYVITRADDGTMTLILSDGTRVPLTEGQDLSLSDPGGRVFFRIYADGRRETLVDGIRTVLYEADGDTFFSAYSAWDGSLLATLTPVQIQSAVDTALSGVSGATAEVRAAVSQALKEGLREGRTDYRYLAVESLFQAGLSSDPTWVAAKAVSLINALNLHELPGGATAASLHTAAHQLMDGVSGASQAYIDYIGTYIYNGLMAGRSDYLQLAEDAIHEAARVKLNYYYTTASQLAWVAAKAQSFLNLADLLPDPVTQPPLPSGLTSQILHDAVYAAMEGVTEATTAFKDEIASLMEGKICQGRNDYLVLAQECLREAALRVLNTRYTTSEEAVWVAQMATQITNNASIIALPSGVTSQAIHDAAWGVMNGVSGATTAYKDYIASYFESGLRHGRSDYLQLAQDSIHEAARVKLNYYYTSASQLTWVAGKAGAMLTSLGLLSSQPASPPPLPSGFTSQGIHDAAWSAMSEDAEATDAFKDEIANLIEEGLRGGRTDYLSLAEEAIHRSGAVKLNRVYVTSEEKAWAAQRASQIIANLGLVPLTEGVTSQAIHDAAYAVMNGEGGATVAYKDYIAWYFENGIRHGRTDYLQLAKDSIHESARVKLNCYYTTQSQLNWVAAKAESLIKNAGLIALPEGVASDLISRAAWGAMQGAGGATTAYKDYIATYIESALRHGRSDYLQLAKDSIHEAARVKLNYYYTTESQLTWVANKADFILKSLGLSDLPAGITEQALNDAVSSALAGETEPFREAVALAAESLFRHGRTDTLAVLRDALHVAAKETLSITYTTTSEIAWVAQRASQIMANLGLVALPENLTSTLIHDAAWGIMAGVGGATDAYKDYIAWYFESGIRHGRTDYLQLGKDSICEAARVKLNYNYTTQSQLAWVATKAGAMITTLGLLSLPANTTSAGIKDLAWTLMNGVSGATTAYKDYIAFYFESGIRHGRTDYLQLAKDSIHEAARVKLNYYYTTQSQLAWVDTQANLIVNRLNDFTQNGKYTLSLSGGATEEHFGSGEVVLHRADGTTKATHSSGSWEEKNASGQVTSARLADSRTATYAYNQDGSFVRSLSDGSVEQYDTSGLIARTDYSGGSYRLFSSDGTSVLHETDGGSKTADAEGSITSYEKANGDVEQYFHDGMKKLTHPDGSWAEYDAAGLIAKSESDGITITYLHYGNGSETRRYSDGATRKYDASGNLLSETLPFSFTVAIATNNDNSRAITYSAGDRETYTAQGSLLVRQEASGEITRFFSDGTSFQPSAQGLTWDYREDGSLAITAQSGLSCLVLTSCVTTWTDEAQVLTFDISAEGALSEGALLSDGRVRIAEGNTWTDFDLSAFETETLYLSGVSFKEDAAGVEEYLLPNGTIVTRSASGSISATDILGSHPAASLKDDGSLLLTYADGSKDNIFADGKLVHENAAENVITTYKTDGNTELQNPDGSAALRNGNILLSFTPPQGATLTQRPDGTSAATLSDGSVSRYAADGTLLGNDYTFPGTGTRRILYGDGSTTYVAGFGMDLSVTQNFDGTFTVGFQDGSTSTYSPGGNQRSWERSGITSGYGVDGVLENIVTESGITMERAWVNQVPIRTYHLPGGITLSATEDSSGKLGNFQATLAGEFSLMATLNLNDILVTNLSDSSTITLTPGFELKTKDGRGNYLELLRPDGSSEAYQVDGSTLRKAADGSVTSIT
ncbi:MAG: hypothetical protein V2A78_06915, partial [bacterium]